MDRQTIRGLMYAWLGTTEDDPSFPATLLDPAIQQSYDSLVEEIRQADPDYLVEEVTLAAVDATSHRYLLEAQAARFSSWIDIRYDDEDGLQLQQCRYADLPDTGSGFFALSGPDGATILRTSKDTEAGKPLWLRYASWPVELAADIDVPSLVPARFHDVIGLEALFVFGVGGEQKFPDDLKDRWRKRRAQLLDHVSRRGPTPSSTRIIDED